MNEQKLLKTVSVSPLRAGNLGGITTVCAPMGRIKTKTEKKNRMLKRSEFYFLFTLCITPSWADVDITPDPPVSYDCSSGYFLPANTTGCATCPNGYTCAGGTYTFNETQSQGLVKTSALRTQSETNTCASNFPKLLFAVYNGINYTCASGYFLPANAIECATCPDGYTCAGGTYTFNETISQGLVKTSALRTQNESNTCASNFPKLLFAVYVPNNISLSWKDENNNVINTNTCNYDQPITLPPTPTRQGYTFNGWKVVNN